jgi:hypothetical protein
MIPPYPPPEWDRILSASQKNLPDEIRRLVEVEGVDPKHANRVGQSALHIAALWGHGTLDCYCFVVVVLLACCYLFAYFIERSEPSKKNLDKRD